MSVMQTIVAFLLAAVVFKVVSANTNAQSCPADWIHMREMCVWISDKKVTYWQAYEYCKENQSHLAYLENSEQNYMLAGALYLRQMESVWIGFNDLEIPNVYKWADNEPITYSDFHPENHAGETKAANCVAMRADNDYKWTAEYCFTKMSFVCRKNLSPENRDDNGSDSDDE